MTAEEYQYVPIQRKWALPVGLGIFCFFGGSLYDPNGSYIFGATLYDPHGEYPKSNWAFLVAAMVVSVALMGAGVRSHLATRQLDDPESRTRSFWRSFWITFGFVFVTVLMLASLPLFLDNPRVVYPGQDHLKWWLFRTVPVSVWSCLILNLPIWGAFVWFTLRQQRKRSLPLENS